MDLTVGEGDEVVPFQEIENTLAEKIHNDADMAPKIEAVTEMDTPVPVFVIVCLEGGQHS